MSKALYSAFSLTLLFLFTSLSVQAQSPTVISISTIPDQADFIANIGPSTCTTIRLGETIRFEASGACGETFSLSNDRGITTLMSATNPDLSFDFTFTETGEYTLFCNGSTDPALPTASSVALCIIVSDPVPTVGEWGVITLGLLMLIFMVAAYKTQSHSTTVLS